MESYQDELFRVLKNPFRRAILLELRDRDLTPSYFAFIFELSPSAITKHLKMLESIHAISRYRQGREVYCRINIWGLKAMKVDWLIDLLL